MWFFILQVNIIIVLNHYDAVRDNASQIAATHDHKFTHAESWNEEWRRNEM